MKEVFKYLGWFFKLKKKKYLWCLFYLILVSVLPVVPAKLLGLFIDEITMGTMNTAKIILYPSGLIICAGLTFLTNYLYHYNINKLGQDLSFMLRENYINHLFEMDRSFYEKYTKGDLIARATNDLMNLQSCATSFLQGVVYYSALILSSLVMMIFINPLLAIATCAFMPPIVYILDKKRKKKREYYKIHHEIYSNMTENVLESIEGVKTVRAYGIEDLDFKKTKAAIDGDIDSWKKILKFEAIFVPMFELVYAAGYFIALSLGTFMVIKSMITPGELVSFLVYVGLFNTPLVGLAGLLNQISTIQISFNRYKEIMDEESLVKDEKDAENIMSFNELVFSHVSFTYPYENINTIKDISLTIKKGETIGIVGPTGCGKSTLIRQLLREFNPTSGEILLDGKPIEHYKIEDIRNLVGYVPQNHILFERTAENNILIGNPIATGNMMNHAITTAEFKKDLGMLPMGLNTMVAELGESLSGGQKQRLSIARALIKDPDILILDDSLSAVDAITETKIIEHLKEDRKNKTNIIVAHRFSAVENADKIIVMENGSITNVGTHKELLSYENWYKAQYLKQIKGDLDA